MPKRYLSPAPLPAAKRLHTSKDSSNATQSRARLSFNDSLYDELILCIFSYLSWGDLCTAQATNRNWYRLAADNELWRNQFLKVFGRSRLRGSKGFVSRSDGREVRPLPGRVNSKQDGVKDWKWMFRISSNWRRGRCTIEELHKHSPQPQPLANSESSYQTHVLLAGALTVTASSQPSHCPTIDLFDHTTSSHTLLCESQLSETSFEITAIAIDQSPPVLGHLRLAAFLSTGEFSIFSLNPTHLSTSYRKLLYVPNRRNTGDSPIIQAVYHHPLLITLSQRFKLSLYDLTGDTIQHTQTLTSFTSFPPSSLVLSTPTSSTYKLVLAYTIPVYPAHWSVGATELIISGPVRVSGDFHSPSLPSSLSALLPTEDHMRVISTRTIRALEVPQGWIDENKLLSVREQWSRKVTRVADTQTDGKWVVLAPAETAANQTDSPSSFTSENDNRPEMLLNSTTLQLYRLYLPSVSHSIAASPPKLTFVRSLYGQLGPVSSLALSDGRCISVGLNDSLWVWDLEAGTGAEVSMSSSRRTKNDRNPVERAVAFDERRIVTTQANRVSIHRFDV